METIAPAIDITAEERKTILQLLEEHLPDVASWIYGSRAKWTSSPKSDLDLVVFATPEQQLQVGHLREAFEESNLQFRVDLFVWHDLPEAFKKRIESDHVVIRPRAVFLKDCAQEGNVARQGRTTFGECGVLVRDTVSPSDLGPVPYIGLEHIGKGTLSLLGHGTADDTVSVKSRFQQGDILFGKLRPYFGKLVRAPFDGVCSTDIWVVRSSSKADTGFLYYLMASQPFIDAATRGAEGTRMPRAKWDYVSRFRILLPSLSEQRKAAEILEALDSKIELNRRMNETLEAMERALFKSWFVDFDPVRAKMEGRDTGLPKHIADLFPNRLADSELGLIPKGWEVKALGDLIELAYGKALPQRKRRRGSVPVYGSNGQVGWHDEKLIDGPGIIVGRKGNPGLVKWSPTGFFPIDTTFYVVPKGDGRGLFFLYHVLRTQALPSIASDSAVPGINRNLAYMNRAIVPPTNVVDAFSKCAKATSKRQYGLKVESRTLAALRDTLLPKLISGEIRLQKAEQLVESVT